MKENNQDILSLLPKYFNNELGREDVKVLKDWLEENEGNRMVFDEMRDIWYSLNSEEKKRFDADKAWKEYGKWIDEQQSKEKHKSRFLKVSYTVLKYASVIVFTLFVSYHLFYPSEEPKVSKPFIVQVPKGQTSIVTLYDGTTVRLNSKSKLVCKSYNSLTERRVTLSGEGYFKVKHDSIVPFYVDVRNMTIRVYGTEFDVYAYEDESFTQTTLVKGKIGVRLPNGKEYILKSNEMFKVNNEGHVNVVEVDVDENISWLAGYYNFKNEKLKDIARHLERMFDVKVVFDSKGLKEEKYAGKINADDHIDDVLQKLQMASSFTLGYSLKNGELHFYKKYN